MRRNGLHEPQTYNMKHLTNYRKAILVRSEDDVR